MPAIEIVDGPHAGLLHELEHVQGLPLTPGRIGLKKDGQLCWYEVKSGRGYFDFGNQERQPDHSA